tara:strand:- start:967 stop:1164 length:198 start_codon:yes stop_codon:yes gene_type:complete
MSSKNKKSRLSNKPKNYSNTLDNTSKVISNMTRKDIEKSYNLESADGTEAYYSNRYGWTLRKTLS